MIPFDRAVPCLVQFGYRTKGNHMKIRYERQTCTRCGGTGHYSYNSIDGSRCYGCYGKGEQLTKAGSKAREAVAERVKQELHLPISEVEVGMRVKTNPSERYYTVTDAGPDKLNDGFFYIELDKGTTNSHRFISKGTVQRAPSQEEWDAIVQWADETFPGATAIS